MAPLISRLTLNASPPQHCCGRCGEMYWLSFVKRGFYRNEGGIMYKPSLIRTAATVLLIAAFALPSARRDGLTYGLLLFGLANVFLDIPGATPIRVCCAVVAVVGLAFRENGAVVWSIILAWLFWPPAVMVAWTQSRRSTSTGETGPTSSYA